MWRFFRAFFACALLSLALPALAASKAQVLNLFIWGEYTSPKLLKDFTAKTGIVVKESNYGTNEELLAKLQGGARGYDIAVPSDYMVAVMRKLDLIVPLNRAEIPNFINLDPQFLNKDYDPENRFSIPYSWTTSGLAVNTNVVKEKITSWGNLFQNEAYAGKISALDDMREVLGAALRFHGNSMNSKDPKALAEATKTVQAAKARFRTFNSAPGDLLKNGDVVIAHMYSQEAMLTNKHMGGHLQFIIPKEGSTLAIDNMVVLKDAPHAAAAYKFINFMLDVTSNKTLIEEKFAGPILKDVKSKLPKALQSNSILFPEQGVFKSFEMLHDLDEATELFEKAWVDVKTGKK